MARSTKTFGQFRVNKDGIETVSPYPYRYIDKDDIIGNNQEPLQTLMRLEWVSKSDLNDAYQYAQKIFCEDKTKQISATEKRKMMKELSGLSWKENAKGNHVLITDQKDVITVFKDSMSNNKLKWVVGGFFSPLSYKSLEHAKKDAYEHYYLSKKDCS